MHPYRLAVCDDDGTARAGLSSLCHAILAEDGIPHEISPFSSAQALKEAIAATGDPFDLLILDIQMEGITGMELAHSLRRSGDRTSILFVSGCEEYLPEGYAVQPIHFLLKPVDREALAGALRTDWRLNHQPQTAVLRMGNRTVCLPAAEIQYIESYNHNIVVHQACGDRSFRLSLSEAERQMPGGQFCRCHNSYLINMEYVEEISRKEILLRGGARLPVGRNYYKALQSAFIRYLNR